MISNIRLEIGIIQRDGPQIGCLKLTDETSKAISVRFENANIDKFAEAIYQISSVMLGRYGRDHNLNELKRIIIDPASGIIQFIDKEQQVYQVTSGMEMPFAIEKLQEIREIAIPTNTIGVN